MPIEMQDENGGKLLVVKLIGTLVKEDYKPLMENFKRLYQQNGKLRVLLDMTSFHGWDSSGLWQEVKFDAQHLNEMERMAVVGDKRWHHAIAAFARPFTPAEMRYFEAPEAALARQWLVQT